MKAMVMTAPGAPKVLQLLEVPTPTFSGGRQLLVRLHAAGVNPVDTKLRSRGTYFPERMPAILGCDGAGVVEATGPEAQDFQAGDAVYFCNGGIGGHPGTYAEYAVIDERFAAPKPRSLSFAEAAAVPLALITAWEALHERAHLQQGQCVLIHAGCGGVGHLAIQLAKLHDARVFTTVSDPAKAQLARELGAELAVSYHKTDFVAAVNEWSGGHGADLALDTVGGVTFVRTVRAVRHYGDLVTLLQPGAEVDWKEARLRNLRISFELMLTPMLHGLIDVQQQQADILRRAATLFDAGKLRIHISHVLPLAKAAEAHRLIEAGGMTGKIALTLAD
ncbi:MAG: zinc-dependent alcohol dehydrogenase family protein [Pseudomonadota bacterium]